jgi:thiol-disulfide isomerase/thioredoxin
MRKILSASLVACAALALSAPPARGSGDGVAARRRHARKATAQSKRAAQRAAQKPAPQSAKQQPAPQVRPKPKVAELNEEGLRALLKPGEPRERPLVVNFWATWCTPCREEFPDLVRLRERYAADRLDLLLVSLDDISDISTTVPDVLVESGAAALPAYLLNASDEGAAIGLVDPRWMGELPATFLYDRAGRLVFDHKGRIKPADLQTAIDKTLGQEGQR